MAEAQTAETQAAPLIAKWEGVAQRYDELTKQLSYAMSQRGPYLIDVIM